MTIESAMIFIKTDDLLLIVLTLTKYVLKYRNFMRNQNLIN